MDLFLLELQPCKSQKCLITGVALCSLRWNLVMYGSNSHRMCLYGEKTSSVAIAVGRACILWMDGFVDWHPEVMSEERAQNFVL